MSDDLTGAVARREHERETPLPAVTESWGPPDEQAILRHLGLNPADPRAHAVVLVANRYGLDPLLGEVLILPKSNRPYITRDGYVRIAHNSGVFDGMEIIDGPRRDGAEREWVATVAVYRKDMSHPFAFPGRCELGPDNAQEMAIARAERRAFRRAFAVTLPPTFAEDEFDDRPYEASPAVVVEPSPENRDDQQGAPVPPEPQPGEDDPASKDQVTAIQAGFKDLGITDRGERLALISEWAEQGRVTSASKLTAAGARKVLDRLADRRADAERAQPERDPGETIAARPVSRTKRNQLIKAMAAAGVTSREDVMNMLSGWCKRTITETSELTDEEADRAMINTRALADNLRPSGTVSEEDS